MENIGFDEKQGQGDNYDKVRKYTGEVLEHDSEGSPMPSPVPFEIQLNVCPRFSSQIDNKKYNYLKTPSSSFLES